MLKCPKCGVNDTVVVDSRDHGDYIRRRRKCRKCGHKQTTYEQRLKMKKKKVECPSKEQIERYRAAFKCLELAKAEMPETNEGEDLISIACEYGAGINLTKKECLKLLDMKVRDIIDLEI
jgi:Zn ribbon nucleic-acid-binding protein